jgi:hypothetical protein
MNSVWQQEGEKYDDKISAALSRLYFFDQVRVGTDAVYRNLWKFEADHSGPLRVLRAERR